MKKTSTTLLKFFLLLLILLGFGLINSFSQVYNKGVLQGSIRVKLNPAIISAVKINSNTKGVITTGVQSIDKLNSDFNVTEMSRVFPYSPKYEAKHEKYGLNLWYEIKINSKASPNDVAAQYRKLPEVINAEEILEKILVDGTSKPIYLPKSVKGSATEYFNDPYLSRQWHYNNTGQTGGKAGSDINAYAAWNITKGSKNVIVSIHDQGVDVDHEDLKDAMWVNEAELKGVTGVDDDGNGYKDDIYGFNFAANMGAVDAMYHGTHVAGTVGAVNNNGTGVSGVAGGSGNGDGVRIMTCQILGGTGWGNTPDSYVYAADMGALISQNSWGYSEPYSYEQVVLDAIDYFIAEAGSFAGSMMKGGIVLFAAGNSAWQYPSYPGYYSSCIAVSALNASNHLTIYSNYGTWVDLSAPGGQSEDNANLDPNSEYKNGVLSTLENDAYGYLDGTSMACPHVSGIAALVVSKFGGQNFTNTELKNRLLTGTRFIDTIAFNQTYAGKIGTGAVDALLTLATDNGTPPAQITDLTLSGIAQDFAKIVWTVPIDNDDVKPVGFEVVYSDTLITDALMSYAKTIRLSSRLNPGERDSLEILSLKAQTKYRFAVRSVDRWGNKSVLSNIVVGKTNAGPDAQFDQDVTTLNISIDASINPVGTADFNINNNGEGMLKWTATTRHKYANPTSTASLRLPEMQKSHYEKNLQVKSRNVGEYNHIIPLAIDKPANDYMSYISGWNLWILGETDSTYTNSSATRFYVSGENGFNLTTIEAFLNHKESTGPVILEIYEGENLGEAKIVYQQEVDYTSAYGYTYINLSERIFFEKEKYFWIVLHVPSMNLYPLGAALETTRNDSKNCYYSSDLGKTWNLFEDVYYDNQLVWAVNVISEYANLGEYISLSPVEGNVEPSNLANITATVDASQMINGNYSANIVINTNETAKPMLRMPVTLSITGHKPVLKSVNRVDFGGVLIGNEKVVEFKIQNTGLGRFMFDSFGYDANWNPIYFDISNTQFSYVSGVNSYFDAKTEQTIKFKFKPINTGNNISRVSIKDVNGNTYSFELIGVGVEPPVMNITPADTSINGLNIGDEINGNFYIKNTGKYPLDFFFPAFHDGSNMSELPANVHKFGYVSGINPGNINPTPVYDWIDISSDGTDISNAVKTDHDFYQIDLGFEFPFFGKNETSIYLSKYGTLSFDTEGYIWSRSSFDFQWEGLPDRIISVLGAQTFPEYGGKVYYKRFVDKFIIQWEDVVIVYQDMATATFQAVLHDNGDININIKNVSVMGWWTMQDIVPYFYVGIEDQVKKDGIVIHDFKHQQGSLFDGTSAIQFENPGQGLFNNLSTLYGTVHPDDSLRVSYKISTDGLYVSNYKEKLALITNDPVNNPGLFVVNFNIATGGSPKIILSHESLDFGQVFQNDSRYESIFVMDTGKAPTDILSATFKYGYFTINGTFPITMKPGRTLYYKIQPVATNLGSFKDTLIIATSENKEYKVAFSSEVIEAPKMTIDITDINETIASGSTKNVTLTISNPGNHELEIAPVNAGWVVVNEKPSKVPVVPSFTYDYTSSKEVNGPVFDWVEINDPANKISVGDIWAGENPWSAKIDLPFNFNFYGVDYNYIYVGYSAIVGFIAEQELNPFGDSDPIPNIAVPNNFIAPFYGFFGPSWAEEYPKTGHYFKAEQDRVIIEFCDFNTGFSMSGPMSIEVILYKTGVIKFQYKMHSISDGDVITGFGAIGVENADGTDGVEISYYTHESRKDVAYELVPVRKYTIPATGSKQFDLTLNAKELYAGVYNSNIKLLNNAPENQNTSIPVTLTVTGSPEIVYNDSIALGEMLIVETPNDWSSPYRTYTKEFEMSNSGTAKVEITQFDISKLLNSRVEAYMLGQDWFGNPMYEWIDVSSLPMMDWNTWTTIPIYLQPNSSMRFRVLSAPQQVATISDTLSIITDFGTYLVEITGQAFNPPVVDTDLDTIRVYASVPTVFETKTLVIENTAGGYDLHYNLEIDYQRNVESTDVLPSGNSKNNGFIDPLRLSSVENSKEQIVNNKENFNRTLSYENATQIDSKLGYGGSSTFFTLTAFKAPSDGFNLTHVQTWYVPGEWLNSKIKVQIYGGSSDIYKASLLHTQIYEYNITSIDNVGQIITIPLEKNLLFYPNETFYVAFGYESGAAYPQGVITMPTVVTNRYLYGNGNGNWFDITSAGAGLDTYGWVVRALESNYQSAVWVSLNSAAADTITVGSSGEVKLDFKAGYANPGENSAKLVINSNDPNKPKKYVTLLLDLNQGPRFEIDKTALSVKENETLGFKVIAKDKEGDNFTMTLKTPLGFVNTVTKIDTVEFTCSPSYNDGGVYTLTVEAEDVLGNKTEASILLTVINVNRAPQVINPIGNTGITTSQIPNILLSTVIADPDGEQLNYSITSSNESVLKIFLANDAVIFTTKSSGTTTVTITGTDQEGLHVSHSFDVTVYPTGIESEIADNIKLYPNPTTGVINLLLPNALEGKCKVEIANIIGTIVYEEELGLLNSLCRIDMATQASGVYMLTIKGNNFTKTIKFVKK